MQAKEERIFKCVVAGEGGVGKTTMIRRLIEGRFVEGIKMTIGTALATHSLELDGKQIKFSIWDFAGEKRFRFFLPQYCKGALGVLLVFDITRYGTFQNLPEWHGILKKNSTPETVFVLVGAKSDLAEGHRAVPVEEAERWKDEHGYFTYIETSSKTGENNREIFRVLAREILKRFD
ncbi:MAG: Rab family GTPase [Promethearchaeota archaeon]